MPDDEEMDDGQDEAPEAMPELEEKESAGSLREIEKDEDDELLPARKSNKALIAGLSVVIFLALFIFFKGEDDPPGEKGIDIQMPPSEQSSLPPDETTEMPALEDEPNGGEILIAGEDVEETPEPKDEGIVPIPKEELAFFDPLSDDESERAPSESEEMALVKTEIPKPAPKKTAPPKPAAKPKVVKPKKSTGAFTIQLGAFKERTKADQLDDQLRKGGYDSFVLASAKDLYRVRVGRFSSRKEAKRVAARIKKSEQLDSFVTLE